MFLSFPYKTGEVDQAKRFTRSQLEVTLFAISATEYLPLGLEYGGCESPLEVSKVNDRIFTPLKGSHLFKLCFCNLDTFNALAHFDQVKPSHLQLLFV